MMWVCPEGQINAFVSSNEPQKGKIQSLPFFVYYSPWNFGDTRSQLVFYLIFFDARYDLINDMSLSQGANKHILMFKQAPKRENWILPFFVCYSPWILCDTGGRLFFWRELFMDIRYDLINGAHWSREENRCIFKFNGAPKRKE